LGTIKAVDIRKIWQNEATDFTPWLAENIQKLGNSLGMDLELRSQEEPVGTFSLDILAHDIGRDRKAIIENQLERTDHDHLGKLLTYAAGLDAVVAIWLAKEFREEHRQVLDWLNQRTGEDVEFYAVVVEALQVDNSLPAIQFRPVAFPNDWRKRQNAPSTSTGTSPRSEAYRSYFQTLIDVLRDQYHFTGARKGQPNSWYFFSSGIGGVAYGASFVIGDRARVELYLDRDVDWNKHIFELLLESKGEIESEIGTSLEWERLDHAKASRIALNRLGSIMNTNLLPEIRKWHIDNLLKFRDVFRPKLDNLV
jgi:hypothetical protein